MYYERNRQTRVYVVMLAILVFLVFLTGVVRYEKRSRQSR